MSLNKAQKMLYEEESIKIGLSREDALCRSKRIVGVNQIATQLRYVWPPSIFVETSGCRTLVSVEDGFYV